jgi:hypothetical protein
MRILKAVYWRVVHPVLKRLGGMPTPADKARLIRRYGQGHETLVETGTYLGDTVAGCLPHFQRINTIELDPALAEAARQRFKNESPVTVIEGDSYTELARLCNEIDEPAVFWLDAHSCGPGTAKSEHDPPLLWELQAIVERDQPDVVLIDDARHMGAQPNRFQRWVRDHLLRLQPTWPGTPTLADIREIVGTDFEVDRDIIRITLPARRSSRSPA